MKEEERKEKVLWCTLDREGKGRKKRGEGKKNPINVLKEERLFSLLLSEGEMKGKKTDFQMWGGSSFWKGGKRREWIYEKDRTA